MSVENNENEALKADEEHRSAIENAYDYVENFDILETITNVGNDEVFTPAKICGEMLDALPDEVWHNPNYRWLNPCSKNGIFEREIALRLDKGLVDSIPDTETRRKHILQDMIFSIGLTKFTSHVARRTLYYCNEACRKCDGIRAKDGHFVNGYAIGNGSWFNNSDGNIKTPDAVHKFGKDGKCIYCGVKSDSRYVDPLQREQYAYQFIHYKDETELNTWLQDTFFKGDRTVKFDIIIGNPPYHLNDGGGTGSSAMPIYQKFVEQAKKLAPKYLSMIIPSRWFSGGKGLDDFRNNMLNDDCISQIHDYLNAGDCFPAVAIEGGVCYFLREREKHGLCRVVSHLGGRINVAERPLLEENSDVFIRYNDVISIIRKVLTCKEKSFSDIVSPRNPYVIHDDFEALSDGDVDILGVQGGKRLIKKILKSHIKRNVDELGKYKLFISKADGAAGQLGFPIPARIIGKAELGLPNMVCTETFLRVGTFKNKEEAENAKAYMETKFFRVLVGARKNKNMTQSTYSFVPMQDFSKPWTDEELYRKYNLTQEEINFIESMIRPME